MLFVRRGSHNVFTMRAIDRDTAEHYFWGEGYDGWHLVADARLSVIEERIPPGGFEKLHHHEKAQQFFYVLEGEAQFHIDGKDVVVAARQGIHIPAGTRHSVKNAAARDLRFVVISQPPSHGDRVLAEL